MDSLTQLQLNNKGRLQVIAISNEPLARLQKYLQRKLSPVWLASDTAANLYRQLGFNYVGQSAIISGSNRIIALVRTDSINQHFIDRLLRGEIVSSSAEADSRRMQRQTFLLLTARWPSKFRRALTDRA